ncbi:hypothetical protein PVAND_005835 [Polypedilum vanderplanki]|uniref:Uncharacterized protein n=1 Tax=Polypedilum vanderplanki TaxID=319348 RepID=A0A9J6C2F1_POLVA|nr:hypothetical protein PVAND_005835 [Polypedilum vanderplanki]
MEKPSLIYVKNATNKLIEKLFHMNEFEIPQIYLLKDLQENITLYKFVRYSRYFCNKLHLKLLNFYKIKHQKWKTSFNIDDFNENFINLHNCHFTITTSQSKEFLTFFKHGEKEIGNGIIYDMVKIMEAKANFTGDWQILGYGETTKKKNGPSLIMMPISQTKALQSDRMIGTASFTEEKNILLILSIP